MNDSDKFQQLGLDDLEEVSGGEALSDRAVAALPKAVPGGICPYCGMKIAVSLYGTAFTNDMSASASATPLCGSATSRIWITRCFASKRTFASDADRRVPYASVARWPPQLRRVASACERGRHAFVRRRRGLGICAGSSAFVSGYAALVPSFPLSGSFARLSDAALLYFDLKDPFSRKDVLWRIPLAPVRRKLCASPLSS